VRLAALDSGRIDAYLARLGTPDVRHDAAGLARLQAAHLMAVPFHNLLLLANDGRPWGLQALHEVVDEAIAGVGGNCDRTTPPFTALLQAVGFDARLAAATVREPGDHFVCVVQAAGGRFLCDVGNGHPYLRPWDLDGPVQEQSFHGWRFRFDPAAPGGPTLLRALPDGALKTVYVVDPTPRDYDDFAPMVTAHYTQAGFGPFLSGLRAVAIQPGAVLTLRDTEYARDTRFGRSVRRVAGHDAVRALLTERFALPPRLVDEALEVVDRRRPELFQEPRWFALGRGHLRDSVGVEPPAREEVPDVLVSLATVGRGASVRRLLDTLAEEVRASRYPGRVGVLIVENHPPAAAAHEPDPDGIVVHRVAIERTRPALDRAAEAGVLPPVGDRLPVPIGAAREAQLAALRAHLAAPVGGLPHPSEHALVVWMVDDDIAFQQLGLDGRVGRHTHLLFRVARFWSELPQHAVVLGTFTGDPPIPSLDRASGLLRDVSATIAHLTRTRSDPDNPDPSWEAWPAPEVRGDSYYDLSEEEVDEQAVWPFMPDWRGSTVHVAHRLLGELARVTAGGHPTRPLLWDGADRVPTPSVRRGGNTLFLDIDALFRWPTPVLRCSDGVVTRRADTLWATLAQLDDRAAVVEATLPVLHGREEQRMVDHGAQLGAEAARTTAGQVRGTVLARSLAAGFGCAALLAQREARVLAQRADVVTQLDTLAWTRLFYVDPFGDPSYDGVAEVVAGELERLREAAAGGLLPGDPGELDAFLARLPDAVRAWRGGW
jgi:arylamine N-acetyltransferase